MTKKQDGRKLDHKTLEAIRIRAVRQVQAGESPEVVIKALGFTRACIYAWLSKYQCGGWDALKAKRLFGRPRKLNDRQIKWIYKAIVGKNPLQLKFAFALWTRPMIRELILRKFKIKLSEVTVGRLLRQLGLSCQKPLVKAFQQNKTLVKKWIKEEYPGIQALADKNGAQIYFEDESGVRSDYHSGRTWAPIGETPVIRATGARFGLNMISAVSAKGQMRFMVVKGTVNAKKFCEFLKRLICNTNQPVYLIVDGHPTHKAIMVKKYLESVKDKLRLFFLPPYSPELNPDEFVWNDLKNHGVGRMTVAGPDDLQRKVLSHMKGLQKNPSKVQSFFQAPTTRYAALNV